MPKVSENVLETQTWRMLKAKKIKECTSKHVQVRLWHENCPVGCAGSRKFIGAKGIGFKSTFCATSTPIVHSGSYHFHFNKEAGRMFLGSSFHFQEIVKIFWQHHISLAAWNMWVLAGAMYAFGTCEALNGLGYLIPFPLERPDSFTSGTRIVLPIYDETKVAVCRRVVEASSGIIRP